MNQSTIYFTDHGLTMEDRMDFGRCEETLKQLVADRLGAMIEDFHVVHIPRSLMISVTGDPQKLAALRETVATSPNMDMYDDIDEIFQRSPADNDEE